MRPRGTTLKLVMKLRRDKPGMVYQFDNLHQAIVSRTTTHHHAVGFHPFAKFVVEFVAMALKDDRFPIGLSGFCARYQATDSVPQTHGAAFVSHLALRWHQIDHGIRSLWIKFPAIGSSKPKHVPGEFDDSDLHPQAEAEVRLAHAACEAGSFHFPFDAAMPKAIWDDNSRHIFQGFGIAVPRVLQGKQNRLFCLLIVHISILVFLHIKQATHLLHSIFL
jgi:hypothetical protein